MLDCKLMKGFEDFLIEDEVHFSFTYWLLVQISWCVNTPPGSHILVLLGCSIPGLGHWIIWITPRCGLYEYRDKTSSKKPKRQRRERKRDRTLPKNIWTINLGSPKEKAQTQMETEGPSYYGPNMRAKLLYSISMIIDPPESHHIVKNIINLL